jgi:hypothetical protein
MKRHKWSDIKSRAKPETRTRIQAEAQRLSEDLHLSQVSEPKPSLTPRDGRDLSWEVQSSGVRVRSRTAGRRPASARSSQHLGSQRLRIKYPSSQLGCRRIRFNRHEAHHAWIAKIECRRLAPCHADHSTASSDPRFRPNGRGCRLGCFLVEAVCLRW